ncbi:MAG: N-acetylglucosamine-6-phosphate deacetylase [Clostridia bacterium]|nr:N-acetylglucosamine-6-phosphate deacetylase [Clostridia bacterium]
MRLAGGMVLNSDFVLEKKDLYINNGRLGFSGDDDNTLDISGLTVIPGLVDLHIHGFGGIDLTGATADGVERVCRQLVKCGVTSFAATTLTTDAEIMLMSLETLGTAIEKGTSGAEIVGINMEGPFISPERHGAMEKKHFLPFVEKVLDVFIARSRNNIKIMTVAPEIEANLNGIPTIRDRGIVVSIGHTSASADLVAAAIEKGATHATHLFNAMSPLGHRDPGAVGAILDSDVTAELICDGKHIDSRVVRLVYKLIGRERFCIISDDVSTAGMPDGEYAIQGQRVVIKDGTCTLTDGTLYGNVNSLFECVRRSVKDFGIPFEDAVYCASAVPSRILGIADKKGRIDEGMDADLVIINDDFEIKYVIKNGNIID